MSGRTNFSSGLGFILVAAASAVGLGNLWRFPYLAAEYGGGIFLFTYLVLAVTLGFVLMITEIAIGRKTGKSAFWAFGRLNKKWHFLGIFSLVIPCIILPYYSVIGGWIMQYGAMFVTNQADIVAADASGFFNTITSAVAEPIIWAGIFLALTAVILLFGVHKGIQRVCTFLLPLLIVLIAGLAVYCIILPGGLDGVAYYFIPDFSKLSGEVILAAMGQVFFSLSLATGVLVTYGSYLSKKENIEKSVRWIEIFDIGAAVIAGFLIVPAVFAFSGGAPESLGAGPGLVFIQLPQVFATIPFGTVVGAVFFICMFLAALTSAVSLFEVPVAAIADKFRIKRQVAVGFVFLCATALAVIINFGYSIWSDFTIFNYQILDFTDLLCNSILMPILAILTCIFAGWILKPEQLEEEIENGSSFKAKKFYHVMIKFIAPVCVAVILIYLISQSI